MSERYGQAGRTKWGRIAHQPVLAAEMTATLCIGVGPGADRSRLLLNTKEEFQPGAGSNRKSSIAARMVHKDRPHKSPRSRPLCPRSSGSWRSILVGAMSQRGL